MDSVGECQLCGSKEIYTTIMEGIQYRTQYMDRRPRALQLAELEMTVCAGLVPELDTTGDGVMSELCRSC